MKIKILFILVFSFLFLGFRVAHASLIINEVQIKPAGESFIELYNNGDASIDLTGWSIKRKTASGTEYSLVSQSRFQGKTINANSYFLLANEGNYTGSIIPDVTWATSYSLANDNAVILYNGNSVVFKTGWGEVNVNDCDVACAPNPSDGQSVQKTFSGWVVSTPTPKAVNENNSNITTTQVVNDNGGVGLPVVSNQVSTENKPKIVESPKIKTKIIGKTLAYVGIPFELEANTLGYSGELLRYGKYYWNFEDGDYKEVDVSKNVKFSHTYYYPGEYEITLEYYSNYYSDIPETINKFVVKVIPATVSISRVGDAKDFFIELSNESDYDIDISKWAINSGDKNFTLPKNTVITSKNKIVLSPKITNFFYENKNNLKLIKPTGEVAYDFSLPVVVSSTHVDKINNTENIITQKNIENNTENTNKDLAASPVLSDVAKNDDRSYFFLFGFVVLLFVSGGVVYYIRQGKNVSKVGDDFKIIDE